MIKNNRVGIIKLCLPLYVNFTEAKNHWSSKNDDSRASG